ncbi:ABC transporter ATP-binding protein [Rhizobium sp. Leaf391]|uniref:ABC transporter ATP-binding protein n=1 Tax=Rhizobium sp. Leaf391 TaxID=1736360 RepID=UPI0007137CF0|nr:ABC transporter ATP-binding protein [Rhizobium sp. Leaf391]KQS96839.1 ABC transporter ATP-binding protein [Rhizobium sp. Leaf391]
MSLIMSNIHKSYATAEGAVEILRGVNLFVGESESVALTGESGSGKSTLLHLAGGLDHPDSGSVMMAGQALSGFSERERAKYRRTKVGLVFQQFNLIPSLNVVANMSFHARLADRYDPAWQQILTERLGLEPYLARYPEQLSGGQQQRVAIGRTLAARPPLILADEPTGNLDEATGDAVLDLMLSLARNAGSALLLVTHSSRLADRLDRKVVLRGGRIVE